MPYTDANGTIMIDEIAANSDLSKLKASRDKFTEALNAIQVMIGENSEMAGGIKESLDESLLMLSDSIKTQINRIDEMTNYLKMVVSTYKAIDQSVKGSINSVMP
ncbi:MAG: hypothetical protein J6Y58_03045 [Clostridiales bacterium]|nr:hypothetical protein [Clostridiales bacterium]